MHAHLEGNHRNVRKKRIGVVVSRFHKRICDRLLSGALDELSSLGVTSEQLTVLSVPGAFEIPGAVMKLAESGGVDVILTLGAVIRGETSHYDYVAGESARGIAEAGIRTGIPVLYGVLTTEDFSQAYARSGGEVGHKGRECARAAIEMADLYEKIDSLP